MADPETVSKDYLQGKSERERIFVHPEQWYRDNVIDLRLGVAARSINLGARSVSLDTARS